MMKKMVLVAGMVLALAGGSPLQAEEMIPEKVMVAFEKAFVAFDFAKCRSLLAQDALITITRRSQGGEFSRSTQNGEEWLDMVAKEVHPLKDFKAEILESHTLMDVHGATVVYRMRATALAPGGSFTSRGTNSGNLVREEGRWKILQYNMFEDFRWEKKEGSAEPK